mgnify:CR=1 FL=1
MNEDTDIVENSTLNAKFVKANITVKIVQQVSTTETEYREAQSVSASEFTVPNGTTAKSTYGKEKSIMEFNAILDA